MSKNIMAKITSLATKLLLSFFVFLILVFPLAPAVHAQSQSGNWYDQTFPEWYSKVYDSNNPSDIFGERYTAAQVQWVIYGFASYLIRASGNPDAATCLISSNTSSCVETIKKIFDSLKPPLTTSNNSSSFLATVFEDRPLSGITYFKETARNWHLIPQVKAQTPGFGFGALEPILPLWRAARNIAFALFVIIILVLAFMIMFRVKISPQTVISVQSALPKVAIALVLVTFSYAIAGFLVDLMYVVTGLISLLLAGTGALFTSNPITIFNFLTKGTIAGANVGIVGLLVVYLILFSITLLAALFFGNGLIGGIVEVVISGGIAPAAFSIISVLAAVVLLVVLFIAAIKIFWMLIKTFVMILLLVISAPFQIAIGAVTQSTGFSQWLKSFISNLAVFPLTGLLFALSYLFLLKSLEYTVNTTLNLSTLSPNWDGILGGITNTIPGVSQQFTNTGWPPLLGTSDRMISLIFLGASLAILLMVPKIADIIKGMIEGKPFAYGTAIGEAFAVPAGLVSKSPATRAVQEALGRQQAKDILSVLTRIYPSSLPGGKRLAEAQKVAQRQAQT